MSSGRARASPVRSFDRVVVVSVQGLGGDFAEEPVFRCEPATQATEPFLECPAQAR